MGEKKLKKNKEITTAKDKHKLSLAVPAFTIAIVLLVAFVSFVAKQKPLTTVEKQASSSAQLAVTGNNISLPQPQLQSGNSVEAMIKVRRSRRTITNDVLDLKQVSQVLWSAQGVTADWGGRAAPSAKSTYPLTVYLLANKVDKLENGQYRYIPGDRLPVHQLAPIKFGDFKNAFYDAVNQSSVKDAAVVLIITGDMGKMADAYGGKSHDTEVYLEAGHVAENIYLQAESLKLGTVAITSFDAVKIREILTIPDKETIIYVLPFGHFKD